MSKYDRWIVIRGMSVVIRKLCLQCSVMFGLLELHYAELIVWEFWIRRSLPPSDLFEERAIVVNLLFMTLHCSYFQFLNIEWFSFNPSKYSPVVTPELKYIFPDFLIQNSVGEGSKGRYAYVQVRSSTFECSTFIHTSFKYRVCRH